ncbi:L-aspartate oxidase [Thermodesulfobacteriota bacterium]
MELKSPRTIDTDVLVIGSGGAGLRAAIEARRHEVNVLLISKSPIGRVNNTAISGSGIAVGAGWKESADSTSLHFQDTVIGGKHINDQRMVEVMASEIEQQVLDLECFGVKFRKKEKAFHMARMAGHTHPRNVFCDKTIGTELTLPLCDYATQAGVNVKEDVLITRLLTSENVVRGALGIDETGNVFLFNAKSTILATGGAGHIYLQTSNAAGSTGDGFALAYELGVPIADMEFVQFSLSGPNAEMFCAREGAVIRNSLNENILEKHDINHPVKMTRDAVSRAIMTEILEGRSEDGKSLALDTTPISEDRFEKLRVLLPKNTPREKRHFKVGLYSHFFMGGVRINEKAETTIGGLYAAGEVCSGVHGASRLGGNGLAEIFVFGKIAGHYAAKKAMTIKGNQGDPKQDAAEFERLRALVSAEGDEDLRELQRVLKTTMWNKAGIVRNEKGLEQALDEVDSLRHRSRNITVRSFQDMISAIKLDNMLIVSEMIIRSALLRKESRGAHYRSDYPEEDNKAWIKNIVISKKNNEMSLSPMMRK